MNFAKFLRIPFFYRTPPVAASVVRRNTKHKKDENTRIEKKKRNLKKNKRNMVSCINIYIVVFAFLSSTIEVGRW